MPRFEPFRATRYADSARLSTLSSPPYDVISDTERTRYASMDEHNIVHVDMPLSDDAGDPYRDAARRIAEWRN
ncbi:MAG: DUF1015 family protein, partial [Actinobacteria bacterium]|nr:DUF1015 family protein [Actinomycetota bacterium]